MYTISPSTLPIDRILFNSCRSIKTTLVFFLPRWFQFVAKTNKWPTAPHLFAPHSRPEPSLVGVEKSPHQ